MSCGRDLPNGGVRVQNIANAETSDSINSRVELAEWSNNARPGPVLSVILGRL